MSWHEMRMAMQGENGHARWLLHGGEDNLIHVPKVILPPCEMTFEWWRGQLNTQCKVWMSSCIHAKWQSLLTWTQSVLCGHEVTMWSRTMTKLSYMDARWLSYLASMQNDKVVSCGCEVALGRRYLSDVQNANDEDFQKISFIYFCKVTLCGHPRLVSMWNDKVVLHGHEVTLGRCYLSDVQNINDEDFQKIFLIYFCKATSHGHQLSTTNSEISSWYAGLQLTEPRFQKHAWWCVRPKWLNCHRRWV